MRSQLFDDKLSIENQQNLQQYLEQERENIINIRDEEQFTILHRAVIADNLKAVNLILNYANTLVKQGKLSQKDKNNWIDQFDSEGWSALHRAIAEKYINIIFCLQKFEVNFKLKTSKGLNALHLATQANSIRLIYYFKQKGCQLGEKDDNGNTELHWACFNDNQTVAQALIALGLDINAPNGSDHMTPLHLGVLSGNPNLVRKLLKKGANKDILDKQNRKPLDLAKQQQFEIITSYLESGGCSFWRMLGCKPRNIKGTKSWHQIFFLVYFVLVQFLLSFYVFNIKKFMQINFLHVIFYALSVILIIFSHCYMIGSNPGYIKSRSQKDFKYLIDQAKQKQLCFECKAYKPERSRHCQICEKCIAVYDHHCQWLSICIGCNNFCGFISFLFILSVGFCIQISLLLKIIIEKTQLNEYNENDYIKYGIIVGLWIVEAILVFAFLFSTILLLMSLCRASQNLTTFQASKQTVSEENQQVQYELEQVLLQNGSKSSKKSRISKQLSINKKYNKKNCCKNLTEMLYKNSQNQQYFAIK